MKFVAYFVLFVGLIGAVYGDDVDDQVAELYRVLNGKKVGMLTNPTSIDNKMNFLPEKYCLDETTPFELVSFFAPEHGLRGDQQDGAVISDYVDELTGRTVYSLYGNIKEPTDEMMADIDTFLFDIQDVGTRFYTFVWTMTRCMEKCAALNKTFVVFDRPNPIGADIVEGAPNTMDAGNIGRKWDNAPFGVPTRHGLTAGELALLVNSEWMEPKLPADKLIVVKIPNYKRNSRWQDLGRPWVMPSPNMPTFDGTAVVYPGTGLFEDVADVSEGRGTTRPFEIIGLPASADSISTAKLTETLNAIGLPGVHFRSIFFTPTFGKLANTPCGGVQLHVTDFETFKPCVTALHLVRTIKIMFGDNVTIYQSISKKTGIANLYENLTNLTVEEIEASWQDNLAKYMEMRAKYLLYN